MSMTRDVFAFTSGFPLAKAGRKAGADRFEEHGGAVMNALATSKFPETRGRARICGMADTGPD
jgi:hypothetical protein